MTKDNASGAGIRFPFERIESNGVVLVEKADATRLLAESQAHNAKLEAQVERLREALEQLIACHDEPSCPALDVARAALKP
jgi:hypothetical protein